MKIFKLLLTGLICVLVLGTAGAHVAPGYGKSAAKKDKVTSRGGDCARATADIDQQINNVRARLLNGGDVWWDGDDGRYVVPKVPAGQPEVSSIFAGAVWVGGYDPAGNLKMAGMTYGTSQGQTDFWPGPLDQFTGGTDKTTCTNWDRFFRVYATEIRQHLSLYNRALKGEGEYTPDLIPNGVKGWPSKGNPHFVDVWGFELPLTGQGLAGYFDENQDGIYDPLDGDFPVIEIEKCTDYDQGDLPQYPDEMIFWIYNDNGGVHTETNGDAIQMEIQVQAFAYATNDFINDMTFQRYKLINRAIEDIRECYFAMWVDPDLGCHTDDYVGCDTTRSLAFIYNQDAVDGQTGCSCPNGVNTYCTNVPILGIDYFRGPKGNVPLRDSNGEVVLDPVTIDTIFVRVELGMSSFTYYNNGGIGGNPPGTNDPGSGQEYYNLITGKWRDGSPVVFGGNGYNTGGRPVKYAFPSVPNCNNPNQCWSMCTAGLGEGDRRTLQATGPMVLKPGDVNELIVGAVWIPEVDYPCPDISLLLKADDVSQALFDNCFDITDGPDAPDLDWIEMDRQIIAILTNDTDSAVTNNAYERYNELDLSAPATLPRDQRLYRFEGYKVFQLASASVSVTELNDPTKAKMVFQADVDNKIGKIYNWVAEPNPNLGQQPIWVPEEKVLSASPDEGIRHSFLITEDQFATSTDRRLVNHKKYYYLAVAYAYNNWEQFNPHDGDGQGSGQSKPYLEGRNRIQIYTVIPRPVLNVNLNSVYGDGVAITRIDGVGAGSRFLDMTDETREAIINGTSDRTIAYKQGFGPFEVNVFNPLDVKNGEFELTFFDENMNNNTLDNNVRWQLTKLDGTPEVTISDQTIKGLNEQILAKYGFSIILGDGLQPGNNKNDLGDPENGAIGYGIQYSDALGAEWLSGIPDGAFFLDYMQTGPNEPQFYLDPTQAFSRLGPGFFQPYYLLDYTARTNIFGGYISPVWKQQGGLVLQQLKFEDLNNVDIVFTSDKSKWSRCIIVEASSPELTGFGLATEGPRSHFDLRSRPSVGKDDANGDGLPDPDGDGEGMGWFPGYAIDVETGERLNIFFGEASIYRCDEPFFRDVLDACNTGIFDNNVPTGADMMWNPTAQTIIPNVPQGTEGLWQAVSGGMHYIYVTKQKYDGCAVLRTQLRPGTSALLKTRAFRDMTWAGFPILAQGTSLRAYKDGLIPNDVVVKLRVDNPFGVYEGTGEKKGYPTYRFKLENREAADISSNEDINRALDAINVVPNPYYGFSAYETSQFSTRVKITNLPAKCVVTIYTLDGKFIRQYIRDEVGEVPEGNNRAIERRQIIPDLEWDLRNIKGIPVSSGVYLIHINANELGLGERTIKWFGIPRQYDPSGL